MLFVRVVGLNLGGRDEPGAGGRRAVGHVEIAVSDDLIHFGRVGDKRDDPHLLATSGAHQRLNVPDAGEQCGPAPASAPSLVSLCFFLWGRPSKRQLLTPELRSVAVVGGTAFVAGSDGLFCLDENLENVRVADIHARIVTRIADTTLAAALEDGRVVLFER